MAVLPLLAHDIVIPSINLVNPSVDLERLKDNRNNWTLKFQQSSQPSTWNLQLHDIALDQGNIAVSDEITKADMHAVVNTLGQTISIGEAMKQQEEASRKSSAQVVGAAGAGKLDKQVSAAAASEVAAASEASAVAAASNVAPNPASTSANSSITTLQGPKPPVPDYGIGWTVKGKYNGTAVSGNGKLGSILAVQGRDAPVPGPGRCEDRRYAYRLRWDGHGSRASRRARFAVVAPGREPGASVPDRRRHAARDAALRDGRAAGRPVQGGRQRLQV